MTVVQKYPRSDPQLPSKLALLPMQFLLTPDLATKLATVNQMSVAVEETTQKVHETQSAVDSASKPVPFQ